MGFCEDSMAKEVDTVNNGFTPPPGGNAPPEGCPQTQEAPGYPQAPVPPQAAPGYPQAPVPPQAAPGYPQAPVPPQAAPGYPQAPVPPQAAPPVFWGAYPGPVWYGGAPFVVNGGKPPKDPRKQGASRTFNRMCLLLLAQVGLSFFWSIPFTTLLMMLGVDILSNSIGYLWLSGILVPLSTGLPFVAYLIFRRKDPSDYLKFEKVGFSGGLLCVLGGLALSLLGNYPAFFISEFLEKFGYESSPSYTSNADSLEAILLEIAVVAVLVPFIEEMVFRGVVLSALRKYGLGFSIVASGLVFGMAHLNFPNVVFATISGLVFGFIYAKTNNLWLTILIHGLNNFIATFGAHTQFFFGDKAYLADNLLTLVPIGAGILALIFLVLVKRDMFISYRSPRYDGPAQPLGAGESAVVMVRAPLFWVMVAIVLVYTASMFFVL